MANLSKAEQQTIAKEPSGKIPPEVDRLLLKTASTSLGHQLNDQEKRELRRTVVDICRKAPSP